jgi:hypothetical protein
MRLLLTLSILTIYSLTIAGQYPFEKYPAVQYKDIKDWKIYDRIDKEKKIHLTMTIPQFFDNKDSLTIQLTSFITNKWTTDSSFIRIYINKILQQKIFEPMFFNDLNIGSEPIRMADINGDKLMDLKLTAWYMGNGIASMNVRRIYLFQNIDNQFTKISFADKLGGNDRLERDFDGDGNNEIITMNLKGFEGHSYWLFNLYNYVNGELVNVNEKANYPIMIQFLYRDNYEITDRISRDKMKDFTLKVPDDYDKK